MVFLFYDVIRKNHPPNHFQLAFKSIKTMPAGVILLRRRMLYLENKKAPMSFVRTVWVVDIYDYLIYLENCLTQLAYAHPHVRQLAPIERQWDWTQGFQPDDEKSERDQLVDWIIRQEIHEVFYLHATNHYAYAAYQVAYYQIQSQFDLSERTRRDIFIPKFYGDIHPRTIRRQGCWLYIECDVQKESLSPHVLSGNPAIRYPSKCVY